MVCELCVMCVSALHCSEREGERHAQQLAVIYSNILCIQYTLYFERGEDRCTPPKNLFAVVSDLVGEGQNE